MKIKYLCMVQFQFKYFLTIDLIIEEAMERIVSLMDKQVSCLEQKAY